MKFITSLLITTNVLASPINLYHEANPNEAAMYREIFVKDYNIPDDLIAVKITKECEKQKSQGKLDLCLKNNGDLFVVSVDRKFIDESLKVFKAP